MTNQEFISKIMKSSVHHQAFVMTALIEYSANTVGNKEEFIKANNDSIFVNAPLWVNIARDIWREFERDMSVGTSYFSDCCGVPTMPNEGSDNEGRCNECHENCLVVGGYEDD